MKRTLIVALLAACGDDAVSPLPDAAPGIDAPPALNPAFVGHYERVVPAYEDEATCRAQNPDPIVACKELMSLCASGKAHALYTDIISGGMWAGAGETVTVMLTDASFSQDGTFELTRDAATGAVSSPEIYGDRAFVRGEPLTATICDP